MSFGDIKIKVDGQPIQTNVDEELEISDLSKDMDQVAAKMAYWAAVWAAANAEEQQVDAHYRKWRADTGVAVLGADPKMAEWKVKQAIESDPHFMKFKEAASRAARNTILTKGVFESFKIKANMLQSKGAMQRSELDATGMATRRKTPLEVEEVKSAMRTVNKKKSPKA